MKKHITLLLVIIATLCLSMFFVSCGQEEEKAVIKLSKSSVNLVLGFTENINASYDKIDGFELTWSSSDESIVTVNNGKLEGMKQGNATVTATYSNGAETYTASANVAVGLGGYVPTLCVENYLDEDMWNIVKGDSVEFKPYVYFNGVKFYDVEVNVSVGNSGIISYEDNTITALSTGSTNIVLEGTWRGITFNGKNAMGISLGLNVLTNFELLLNNNAMVDEIELYTRDEWQGESFATSMPFNLVMKYNGVTSNVPVDIDVKDESVVAYNNGVLAKTGFGQTEIELTWTAEDGQTFSKTVDVNVIRPVGEYATVLPYFSAIDGAVLYDIDNDGKYEEVTLAQVLYGANTDKVFVDAFQTYYNDYTKTTINDELTISNNTLNGVYTYSTGMRDVTLTVGTLTEIYIVKVKACAKVFAQDNIDEFYSTLAGKAAEGVKFTWYQDGGVVSDYEYYYSYASSSGAQTRHRGYYTL